MTIGKDDVPGERATRTRANTRARLVRAGRRLFLNGEFQAASVDSIARAAGFTRAAFYLHFPDKDTLLAAIMTEEAAIPRPIFRWFADHPRDAASVEGFIRAFLEDSRRLRIREFHIAALQSPAANEAFNRNRSRLTEILGEHFPAFRPMRNRGPDELARMARALRIVIQLEQLSARELDLAGPDLGEAMIRDLMGEMLRFDADYPA
ncbi:MAG: TetR/AcrR family transcriptional regulator [Novosphingobium sp.]|nr:TetR/AcrR family transcriptional regulator [Novosphingobium sp.]